MNAHNRSTTRVFRKFQSICTVTPDAVAAVAEDASITYQQLHERVLGLCEQLTQRGLADTPCLPLVANRCLDYLVTLLACAKLGLAYVAIDPGTPAKRIVAQLDQLGCNHVLLLDQPEAVNLDPRLTHLRLDESGALSAQGPAFRRPTRPYPMDIDPLTVMFTSGTTGVPKGVLIGQDGLLNLVENVQRQVQGLARNYVHHSSIGFDAALFEVWVPLLTGACVTLHKPAFNIETLCEAVQKARCDVLLLTTSLFHLVAQHRLHMLAAVRVLYVGGEVLKPVHARALLAANPGITLINGYGPTENTVFSTWHSLGTLKDAQAQVIPIGHLLGQVYAKVVNADLREVTPGTSGELLLGGRNLALGYLDVELTRKRFLRLPEGIYYRTGDYVIEDEHGVFRYQGRIDEQVKIHGYRVELAEVEQGLMQLPGIAQAVVLARAMNPLESCLHAFIVFQHGWPDTDEGKLLSLLSSRLPPYMLPSRIHRLFELPVTANGKVDKRALQSLADEQAVHIAPHPAGSAVLEAWSSILGTRDLRPENSIYTYGASSLSVVMAHTRINQTLGRKTPFDEVARLNTLQEWVQYYVAHENLSNLS
ncbi:non-ribosomal peptide synthetase [Pseudomonas proteolytica]|uniref:non-ribosomal peptide synthetase n=1 Tax=Pseudomonas proteolytica TaxID=219574 RepID=UPI0008962979|nr:non-ribosomal peptide synthetase [Pseudomonas proteolytica]KAA8701698.1 non-ribosomal peptide synthetase [Pseudomonas proteolytica]NMZ05109.1 non-ribosomal peptide synthetase [Pseudomonas proteolytica]TWR79126.1 non-ribosomal peptide synthetase [Pseudomonas proteolytica]SEC56199.1 coronamic acid synthetase CmaA, adenylation and thiolation didomain protein [Pseudomonas proteolytica]